MNTSVPYTQPNIADQPLYLPAVGIIPEPFQFIKEKR